MKIQGIEFQKDEIEGFQKHFLGTPAATAVGKVLNHVLGQATERLEDLGASIDVIRQAQGVVEAVRVIDQITAAVGNFDFDAKEDDGEDNQTIEEAIDVGF